MIRDGLVYGADGSVHLPRLEVGRSMDADEALKLWRDTPVPAHLPTVMRQPPYALVLDGEPIVLVDKLDPQLHGWLRRALLHYPMGGGVVRGAGIRNRAQVFGFLAANPILRRSSCRTCDAAQYSPEAHRTLCECAYWLALRLGFLLPDQWNANHAAVTDVRDEWRLPGGLWTSGVVNLNSTLPYHRDRNNFDAWSAMPVVRRGIVGGHLHFPELSINGRPVVLECGDGHAIYFNGQRFMHGVTPMSNRQPDGYRYSAVYYPVKKMASCLPPEEELRRAQLARTVSEAGLIDRQRAAGILRDGEEEA